jgi:hypothetical protein
MLREAYRIRRFPIRDHHRYGGRLPCYAKAMRVVAFASLVAASACTPAARPRPSVISTAETSQWLRTGRYAEAMAMCHDLAAAYDGVRCDQIGTTTEERPIVALSITRRKDAPVLLIQGGIHAGEIEGKDAGFRFLRDLLDGKIVPGALDAVSIVFVPVVNPDGHERFGTNHRPNQRGPEEMGFRTNAARLNLNRDWVKLDSPEIRALVGVIRERDPVMLVDLHATDGAQFEHDIAVMTSPIAPREDGLEEAATALSDVLQKRLTELGHLPLDFYPSFVDDTNPHSGFAKGEAPARFGNFYMGARSRMAVLVETHSWRTYREREQSTYHTLQALLEEATRSAKVWRDLMRATDLSDIRLAGTDVTMGWNNGTGNHEIPFRGYAYEKRLSELTGGTWLVYDEKTPEIWNVPLYDELVPGATIAVPSGGYIVDGGFAASVRMVLDAHGLDYYPVDEQDHTAVVDVFRATKVTFAPPYEGRTRAQVAGTWTAETRTLDRGAIFVPTAQRRARLVVHLFEPELADSLVQWGFFNAAFERKEYIEPYVIETQAREMLAADPALRAAWEAASPGMTTDERLDWLARRHPSWDERVNLLPVYRTSRIPAQRARTL